MIRGHVSSQIHDSTGTGRGAPLRYSFPAMHRSQNAFPGLFICAALLSAALAPPPAAAQAPDSTGIPLTIPGQQKPDTTRTRAEIATDFYRRGLSFLNVNQHAAALQAFRNCVRADPTQPDAYYQLGMLFLHFQDVEEARQCFAEELKRYPDHEQASRELGLVLARQGRAAEGLERLERYRDAHPQEGLAWYALGFAYMQLERPEDAERALREAIRLGPPNAVWHRDLGSVLAARGAHDAARVMYAKALELNPENPTPLINIGNLERREGNAEQALAAYREAERIDSTLNIALQGQVVVLRDLGRHDEVEAVYRRWLWRRPADHGARLEAVYFFQAIEQPEKGLEIANTGARYYPESGDAVAVLGIALDGVGRKKEALETLTRARRLYQTPGERQRIDEMMTSVRGRDAEKESK